MVQGCSVVHFCDLFAAESLVRNAGPEPLVLLHLPPEGSEEYPRQASPCCFPGLPQGKSATLLQTRGMRGGRCPQEERSLWYTDIWKKK